MDDCLLIGGGVVGLSLAYELARQGMRVRLLDRAQPGREASWAGAGILPAGSQAADASPFDRLGALSSALHQEWSARLREETGIDNGYRRCGGLYLERGSSAGELPAPRNAQPIDLAHLYELEPELAADSSIRAAWFDHAEAQIRNPWHLRALLAACHRWGVTIDAGAEVDNLVARQGRVVEVATSLGPRSAGIVVVASGAWSGTLLARAGVEVRLRPIRGQMVLLSTRAGLLRHIVNDGHRYLVPRCDGRLLVGSTEEDVGFDKQTTGAGIGGLLELAIGLVPALGDARFEACWAGLRPATIDRLPLLGRLPELDNCLVATGHFRSGLHLSPITAVLLAEQVRGAAPSFDLTPFAPDRFVAAAR